MYMSENVNYSLHCQHIDMSTSRISDSEHHQSTIDLKLVISWTNESHWKGHTRSPPAVEPPLTGKRSFCLQTDEIGNMCQPEIHINHLSRHHTYLICILYENPRTHTHTHPAHGLGDGLHHAPHHAALTGCLVQCHHDVVHGLLHQLGGFRDGIVGVERLGTQLAD